VEELLPAWAQPGKDVLEVGSRGSCRAQRDGIEWSAASGKEGEAEAAAHDLEATASDVLMRHPVGSDMQRWADQQRTQP
jgi:hypothetical protein